MDHDPDPGIINGILPLQDMGNCQNFVGSAALWEVFGLLMLLLFIYLFILKPTSTKPIQCTRV